MPIHGQPVIIVGCLFVVAIATFLREFRRGDSHIYEVRYRVVSVKWGGINGKSALGAIGHGIWCYPSQC